MNPITRKKSDNSRQIKVQESHLVEKRGAALENIQKYTTTLQSVYNSSHHWASRSSWSYYLQKQTNTFYLAT